MNYVLTTLDILRAEVAARGGSLPDDQLARLYAQLALTTGEATTLEDVHDAWAMWRAFSDRPDHPDLVWFAELPESTQAYDLPYRDAIRATAARLHTGRGAQPLLSTVDIARIVHEAHRELQHRTGDPAPVAAWDDAPERHADTIASVEAALAGDDAPTQHGKWMARRLEAGWRWGRRKDVAAKTHPALVPYGDLPDDQRARDELFVAAVRALAPFHSTAGSVVFSADLMAS